MRVLNRAADLVDAIHALDEWPPQDHGVSGVLAEQLHRTLLQAADETDDHVFSEHLQLRADALKTNDFDAAIRFGAVSPVSIEFLLAPSPSYILPARHRGLSASLAVAVDDSLKLGLSGFDDQVGYFAERCVDDSPTSISGPTFEPPQYSICDLLWLAGSASTPPFPFCNFLPEDEGSEGATTKTVVYRNLYTLRFFAVSLPLFEDHELEIGDDKFEANASALLLRWLRAHDLAHSYFDQICFASGLTDPVLHGTREILADALADALLLDGGWADTALVVVLAEMKRLARRDPALFADAWAGRAELAWLAKSLGNPRGASPAAISAACMELIAEVLARLSGTSSTGFEQWAGDLVSAYSLDAEPDRAVDDVVPVFGSHP